MMNWRLSRRPGKDQKFSKHVSVKITEDDLEIIENALEELLADAGNRDDADEVTRVYEKIAQLNEEKEECH
jgi:hypothetical protein